MDFIKGLPPSKGHTIIMVMVNRLTKHVHFISLKHPFTAKTITKEFITYIVKLHGVPTSIVSERDNICKFFLAKFVSITGHHPQHEFELSSPDRRPNRGGQSHPRTISPLLCWRPTTEVVGVADMGRI